jgi:hypothetical protein
MTDTPANCPSCKVALIGDVIPPEQRHLFGGAERFTRVIGLYDTKRDATVEWACPDCGHRWPRVTQ